MRLLADHQDGAALGGMGPDGMVEDHPRQHRDDAAGHVRRHARYVDDRDRPPVPRHPQDAREEVGHRIGDQHARKHEGVAGVALDLLDLGLDPLIGGDVADPLQLAHLLAQLGGQVGQEIGDGRVDGDARHLGGGAAAHPGGEQAFGEDIGVVLALLAAGRQQDFAMLGEVHQPIGHAQIADVMDAAGVAKGAGIFAMRVDHDDMAQRRAFADAVQDHRRRGGLAGAGRSQDGEMPPQQRVDRQRRGHRAGRVDGADRHRRLGTIEVDARQLVIGDRMDRRAGHGIGGDAAPEAVQCARLGLAHPFPHQVDLGGQRGGVAGGVECERADRADDPAIAALDLDRHRDLSGGGQHRVGRLRQRGQRLAVKHDPPRRPGDGEQPADDRRINGGMGGSRR